MRCTGSTHGHDERRMITEYLMRNEEVAETRKTTAKMGGLSERQRKYLKKRRGKGEQQKEMKENNNGII